MRPRQLGTGQPTGRTSVRTVRTARDVEAARHLFREYQRWLARSRRGGAFARTIRKIDLAWIEEEIASLPGAYGPPGGALFLAFVGSRAVGCGALRRLRPRVGEVKRIYVGPHYRGLGLGRRLTRAALNRARSIGYDRAVLDTLPAMHSAIALYRKMGFVPIPPYWDHPVPNALFFEFRFRLPAARSTRTSRAGGLSPPSHRVELTHSGGRTGRAPRDPSPWKGAPAAAPREPTTGRDRPLLKGPSMALDGRPGSRADPLNAPRRPRVFDGRHTRPEEDLVRRRACRLGRRPGPRTLARTPLRLRDLRRHSMPPDRPRLGGVPARRAHRTVRQQRQGVPYAAPVRRAGGHPGVRRPDPVQWDSRGVLAAHRLLRLRRDGTRPHEEPGPGGDRDVGMGRVPSGPRTPTAESVLPSRAGCGSTHAPYPLRRSAPRTTRTRRSRRWRRSAGATTRRSCSIRRAWWRRAPGRTSSA